MSESENLKAILNSHSYVLAEQDVALLARRELRPVETPEEIWNIIANFHKHET